MNPSDIPHTAVNKTDTVRLIPTAYYKPPVLRRLVQSDEELDALAALEGMTSRRLQAQRTGLSGMDAREFVFRLWGETHINAAFAYTRKGGNRFNDAERGAWYCAFDDLTALDEVGFHKTRELAFINHYREETVYQSLLAGFMGDFHDVRGLAPLPDFLGPDAETAYPVGQALARALRGAGSRGLVYPSARRAGGICLVAFHPALVQNVRPGARWKIVWDGSPDYAIEGA